MPRERMIVSQDGQGNFSKVQEAIDSIPFDNEGVDIFIKRGVYYEKILVNKNNLTFFGEGIDETILEYDDFALKKDEKGNLYTTYRSFSVCVEAHDFKAKNISFRNTAGPGEIVGQAVAVQILGDRCIFRNCSFLAFQDTLYTKGEKSRIYVKDSYIEGDIDFIFGASTAVFEDCVISSINKPGYICAPSTPKDKKYGYLFDKCVLIGKVPKKSVYLGRPWHPGGDLNARASAVFKNCLLGEHINEEAFTEMKGFRAEDARFYEYNSRGLGAASHKMRRQLEKAEADLYSAEKMLKGQDNWKFDSKF